MRRPQMSIALGVLLTSAIVIAQQVSSKPPQVIFRANANLLKVDVSVLDANRRPIHGLTADDFVLTENGIPQPVVAVSEVNVPDAEYEPGTWMSEVAPDVRSNAGDDGRLMIILIDDALLKSDYTANTTKAAMQSIAKSVIDRLGPTDLATVMFTFDKRGVQDFTHDHAKLRAAVESFTARFFDSPGSSAGVTLRNDSLDSFTYVTKYLAALPQRRKALIYVTPTDRGKLTDTETFLAQSKGSLTAGRQQDMFEWAERSGVTVYSISPYNLRDLSAMDAEQRGVDDLAALRSIEAQQARQTRPTLSSDTGGFAITSSSQFDAGIAQIFRETGSYYLVGYSPPDPTADTKLRNIVVKVNRADALVRGRTAYYSDKKAREAAAPPPPTLAGALSGILPKTDLPLQIAVASFARPGHNDAAVMIALGTLDAPKAGALETIEVQVRAFTERGDQKGVATQSTQVLLRPSFGLRSDLRCEVLSELDLKPGQYELRLSAKSAALDRSGSVYVDLDVPDFSASGLMLSGIVVSASPNVPVEPKTRFAAVIPVIPTTSRVFVRTDAASVFMRVYARSSSTPVTVNARITDRQQHVVFDRPETIVAERFGATHAADYRLALPLEALAPGPYLLTIEVGPGPQTIRRDVRFSVR